MKPRALRTNCDLRQSQPACGPPSGVPATTDGGAANIGSRRTTVNSKKLICVGKILGTAILVGLRLAPNVLAQSSSPNVHFISSGMNSPHGLKFGPNVSMSVFATGLLGPRGLKFGPDGALYVAEAGNGGSTASANL